MVLWSDTLAESKEENGDSSAQGKQLFEQTIYQESQEVSNETLKFELKRLELKSHPGVENLIRITPTLFSGAQPIGAQGFKTLQKLGIRTIVSVDGAFPDVKAAKLAGMSYVHIPISYGKVSDEGLLSILHAQQALEKPVFVHCHHGKHRGPTAAALMTIMSGACKKEEAGKILEFCGTSNNYSGLWESVRNYKLPNSGILLPPLMSREDIDPATATMVRLDELMDILTEIEKRDWENDSESSTTELTVLLHEELREFNRLAPSNRPKPFNQCLNKSLKDSQQLIAALEIRNGVKASKMMKNIKQNCVSCHRQFRD